MMKVNNVIALLLSFVAVLFSGCEKFLDAKPDNLLAYPNTLKDLRAILDNEDFINRVYPAIAGIASDEFTITDKGLSSLPKWYSDTYIWDDHGLDYGSYGKPYQVISIANVVLEGVERIVDKNISLKRTLKGEALFLRGWMLFNLAQIYCPPFSVNEQNEGLGLVLRMDSDSEVKIGRSTLKETYTQLFNDLKTALDLLPLDNEHVTRPNRLVCLAALARVYLSIDDYENAKEMVQELLRYKNTLLDYNHLKTNGGYPFSISNNVEMLYFGHTGSTGHFIYNADTYISQELFSMYDEFDLRKEIYFERGAEGVKFRGFYHGDIADYSAVIAMDEVYLTMAECLVRLGETAESLKYLNTLRKNRFAAVHFESLNSSDREIVLRMVLDERKRQLVCRGTRWLDIRRLNRDQRFRKALTRTFKEVEQNKVHVLEPDDLRFTFLIPEEAIEVGGYVQNPR